MERDNNINKVKGFRTMASLTQEELAKKLNISLRAYQNKEQGITSFTVEELVGIKSILTEKGLTVSLDELV